jgi:tetratricopeptide (TPR) repeat protein
MQPNHIKALNNRGAVMEALNRLPEALESYNQALAIAPDFTEPRNNRGRVLIGLDRAEEAIENFTSALKVNPRNAEAWYQSVATRRPVPTSPRHCSLIQVTRKPVSRRVSPNFLSSTGMLRKFRSAVRPMK